MAVLFLLVASASAAHRAMAGLPPEVYHGSFPRKITELDHFAGRLMDLCGQIQVEVQKYHSLMNEADGGLIQISIGLIVLWPWRTPPTTRRNL